MVDADRLKDNWEKVASHGGQVPLFFYSTLFLTHPETRDLFPVNMAGQRDKLVKALGAVVSNVDNLDSVIPYLQQLGSDHRKFGALRDHYPAVGAALMATLQHFSGTSWHPELAKDWSTAYNLVAQVMADAADAAAAHTPAWWDAKVVRHDRRDLDTAVVTVEPHTRLDYRPGQSITVSSPLRPRVWRYYSPANAPRADGTIDLHVRLADAGDVSTALVDLTRVGDVLALGPPVGDGLVLRPDHPERPLLLLAGGTGLAPLKALTEQVAILNHQAWQAGRPLRRVELYWGARTASQLYDLPALRQFAASNDWFSVTACADDGLPAPGVHVATPVDMAVRHGHTVGVDAYLCGPEAMITAASKTLIDAGVEPSAIHFESFGS